MLIDIWKVTRILKVSITMSDGIRLGEKSAKEQTTDGFDSAGFTYLGYFLWPVVLAYSVYQLINYPQRSWYSWIF